jgi:hypothetical protein
MNVTSEKAKKAIRLVLDKKIANEEGYSITGSPKEIGYRWQHSKRRVLRHSDNQKGCS